MLISAALNAETATRTAESTRVTTASVQPDPIARDTPDWREMGRRKVSNGSSSAATAPPIDVAGIDDPGVRAVATTVLDIVARDIQHRLIPPPSGLKLEAKSCGENAEHLAYWNRDRKAIGLCSELIQDRRKAEASYRERKAERYFYGRENRASSDRFSSYDAGQSLLFIAYHELGHALVDIYDLEVGGNEEIAVDGFATWWAVQGGLAGAAVHGAMTFDQFGVLEDQNPYSAVSDIHGRSADRYRNIACWIMGAGHPVPKHFSYDLQSSVEFCRTAYRNLDQQWTGAFDVYDPEVYGDAPPTYPQHTP